MTIVIFPPELIPDERQGDEVMGGVANVDCVLRLVGVFLVGTEEDKLPRPFMWCLLVRLRSRIAATIATPTALNVSLSDLRLLLAPPISSIIINAP